MFVRLTALAAALVAAAFCRGPAFAQVATPAQDATPAPAAWCVPRQIALTADTGTADAEGMSHSGVALVLRNRSNAACRLDPFAALTLAGAGGAPLPVVFQRQTPFTGPSVTGRRFPMGHGPVVLPVVIPPGGSASARLRWVSAPVFDASVCVDAARVVVDLRGRPVRRPLAAHICGRDAAHLTVTTTAFALEPVARRRTPGD